MKICIVCPRLCHGGAERVAVSLANGFAAKGHRVSFLSDLYEEQTYVLSSSVELMNLVACSRPKIRKWLSAIRILRSWLKKERPDVVIGIMSLCSVIAWLAAIGLKIPVIATEHDSYERPASAPMGLWGRIYKFHLSKIFKCVTVLTEADKKAVGSKMTNVVVMPNPLAIIPAHSVPPKGKVVLAAGRVDNWHYKGFDLLIKAWGKMKGVDSDYGEWRLQIAGVWRDEKTREYLDRIARDSGVLDSIDYLGFVEDMKSVYQASSIFVLSSRYEGFGLVLIEAMSQGCACVACDYKGRQKEIFSHDVRVSGSKFLFPDPEFQGSQGVFLTENGVLCDVESVDALAEGIMKMMDDEEYRESVQEKAIECSKYYSIENTINRWVQLIEKVKK